MPSQREIRFKAVIDQNSFGELQRALKSISQAAQEANRAMGGAFGGMGVPGLVDPRGNPLTGGGGQPTPGATIPGAPGGQSMSNMVQFVNANKNIITQLAGASKEANKAISESLSAALNQSRREIEATTKQIDELKNKLGELRRDGASQQATEDIHAQILKAEVKRGEQQVAAKKTEELQQQISGPPGAPPGTVPPGGGGIPWGSMVKYGVGGLRTADQLADMYMEGAGAYTRVSADRSRALTPMFNRLWGNDPRMLLGLRQLQNDPNFRKDLETMHGTVGTVQDYAKAGFKTIAQGAEAAVSTLFPIGGAVLGAAGISSSKMDGPSFLGGGGMADVRNQAIKRWVGQANAAAEAQGPMAVMAAEDIMSTLPGRISSYRLRGLNPFMQTGVTGSMYDLERTRLKAMGNFTPAEKDAAFSSLMGLGGKAFAGQFAEAQMSAAAAGYGQMGQVLAAAARGGNLSAANAVFGTVKDPLIAMQLGSLLGYDPRGTSGGMGLMGAIQGGLNFSGGILGMNEVQRAMGGVRALDQLAGGGVDAFQRAQNLRLALRAAPGASIETQDFLATGMTSKQMMDYAYGGELTPQMRAAGLGGAAGREAVRMQFEGMTTSIFDRYAGRGIDPMGKTILAMRASGLSAREFLQDVRKTQGNQAYREAAENLAFFHSKETGQAFEDSLGAMGIVGGAGGKARQGALPGSPDVRKDPTIKNMLEAEAEKLQKLGDQVDLVKDSFAEAMKSSGVMAKALDGVATNLETSAGKLSEALDGLRESVILTDMKFRGASEGDIEKARDTLAKARQNAQAAQNAIDHKNNKKRVTYSGRYRGLKDE